MNQIRSDASEDTFLKFNLLKHREINDLYIQSVWLFIRLADYEKDAEIIQHSSVPTTS